MSRIIPDAVHKYILDEVSFPFLASGDYEDDEVEPDIDEIERQFEEAPMVRDEVSWFAQEMEKKLAIHDEGRGTHGWHISALIGLFHHLEKEVREVKQELDKSTDDIQWDNLIQECADVANMAMMIADNGRRVRDVEKKR